VVRKTGVARPGEKQVGPGLYLDERNNLHVDVPELLDHFGYVDTPENRDVCTKAALDAFGRIYPNVRAHVVE